MNWFLRAQQKGCEVNHTHAHTHKQSKFVNPIDFIKFSLANATNHVLKKSDSDFIYLLMAIVWNESIKYI